MSNPTKLRLADMLTAKPEEAGKPENRNSGIPENPKTSFQEIQKTRNPENPQSALPENLLSGKPENQNSGKPDNLKTSFPETSNSGFQDFRETGIQEERFSGKEDFGKSGKPETRKTENQKKKKVKGKLSLNIDVKRIRALNTYCVQKDVFLGDALELAIDLLVNQKSGKPPRALIGTDDLDDDDSELNDHHQRVRKAYEDITENDWSKSDDDEYLRVRSIPAEDIIQHMLTINRRAKQTPGSFAYFVTGISKLLNPANQPRGAMKTAYEKIRDELASKYQGADMPPSEFAEIFQRAVAREGLNWDGHLADEVCKL